MVTDMALTALGTKAAAVLAIMGVMGGTTAYINTYMSSYALSADLDIHIEQSVKQVKFELEDKILIIEDELEVYEALKVAEALPIKDAIKEHQLINRKERYLRQLENIKVR